MEFRHHVMKCPQDMEFSKLCENMIDSEVRGHRLLSPHLFKVFLTDDSIELIWIKQEKIYL